MSRELRKIANRFKSIMKKAQIQSPMMEAYMMNPEQESQAEPEQKTVTFPADTITGRSPAAYSGPAKPSPVNPQVLQLQKNLNSLGFKGQDGNKLKEDGVIGKNTNYALQQYRRRNSYRISGSPMETSPQLLYVMIDRDAKGDNQAGLSTENPYRNV